MHLDKGATEGGNGIDEAIRHRTLGTCGLFELDNGVDILLYHVLDRLGLMIREGRVGSRALRI